MTLVWVTLAVALQTAALPAQQELVEVLLRGDWSAVQAALATDGSAYGRGVDRALRRLDCLVRSCPSCDRPLTLTDAELRDWIGFTDGLIEADPQSAMAWYLFGTARFLEDRPGEGVLAFKQALAIDTALAVANLALADAYADRSQFWLAIEHYSLAIEYQPAYAAALLRRARLRDRIGDYDQAVEDVDAALAVDSCLPPALVLRGQIAVTLGDDSAALDSYGRAVICDSTFTEALLARALLYWRLGEASKALADLRNFVTFAEDDNLDLGTAVVRLAHLEGDSALAELPVSRFYVRLGEFWSERGAPRKAIRCFGRAILADSTETKAYLLRGHEFDQMGLPDSARPHYEAVLAMDSALGEAYMYRGFSWLVKDSLAGRTAVERGVINADRALQDFARARSLDSSLIDAHYWRGYVYELKGLPDSAVIEYRAFVEQTFASDSTATPTE
jgi:tetratricopeptide (TPR) repeat protein